MANPDAKANEHAERLAAALRDNLRKRKAQARDITSRDVESQTPAPSEPRTIPD